MGLGQGEPAGPAAAVALAREGDAVDQRFVVGGAVAQGADVAGGGEHVGALAAAVRERLVQGLAPQGGVVVDVLAVRAVAAGAALVEQVGASRCRRCPGAAALIVAALLAAVAAVMAAAGKKQIAKAGTPAPEQAIDSVKADVAEIKEAAHR
ncbi:phage holin family protein [Streptomyces sp. NPDC002773]|uniref:phage holin family protein n=1 Tax=Streptomyces sp. NPDC002773 TaxID=3154430 RepID=UPI003330E67F